jgi:hypothetical protein
MEAAGSIELFIRLHDVETQRVIVQTVLLFSSGFLSQIYISNPLREKLTVLSWQLYAMKSFLGDQPYQCEASIQHLEILCFHHQELMVETGSCQNIGYELHMTVTAHSLTRQTFF